jgi:hypothetical protein
MASFSEMEELVKQLYEEEAERNSELFGIKKEHLIEDAEVKFSYLTASAFSYRFLAKEKKAQIRIPFTARFGKLDSRVKGYLRHEVRHGIARQVRAHVIRQNPEQFMNYLEDNFGMYIDPDNIDQMITFPIMPKWKKEYLSEFKKIDFDSAEDIAANADTISIFYQFAGMNKDRAFASLDESFAEDSRGKHDEFGKSIMPKILAGTTILSAGATAAFLAMEAPLELAAAGAFSTVINGAAYLYSRLMKSHYASLPEGTDLSTSTLEQFPVARRKYLLTFPPVDGDYGKKLKQIRRYGINIKQ